MDRGKKMFFRVKGLLLLAVVVGLIASCERMETEPDIAREKGEVL